MFGWLKPNIDELLEELRSSYGLQWVESNLPRYSDRAVPEWWLGQSSGTQFGIRDHGSELWVLVVGKVPAVVDIELTRVEDAGSTPGPGKSIDDFLPPGHALAQQFRITGRGIEDERFAGPQLAVPIVQYELSELTESVRQVGMYRFGVELNLDLGRLTRNDFDWDLMRAVKVTTALIHYADENSPRDEAVSL